MESVTPCPVANDADCVAASIASLYSMNYGDVVAVIGRVVPDGLKIGLTDKQTVLVLDELDIHSAVVKRKFKLHRATGLLKVRWRVGRKDWLYHCVVLLQGVLYDPQENRIWPDAEDYLAHRKARAMSLMTND